MLAKKDIHTVYITLEEERHNDTQIRDTEFKKSPSLLNTVSYLSTNMLNFYLKVSMNTIAVITLLNRL